jgi:hypothetical protein
MAIIIPSVTNIPILAKSSTLVKKPYVFKGYKFNGTTQYIRITDNAILQPSATFTIEFRMKLTVALASQPQAVIMLFARTVGSSGYDMYLDRAANAFIVQCFPGGANAFTQYNSLSTNVTLTEWHHYAGQYDGSNVKLFVDGVQVSTTAVTSAALAYGTAQDLTIGAQFSGGGIRFLQGYMSDVRFWSTVRTTQQIYDNQFATINDPHAPGLIGYWRLDETSGTNANDFTPNANTGSIVATPPRQIYIFKELQINIPILAKAPKDVGFSVNPKTVPTIHLSAHAPKSVQISKIYPTPATVHLVAKAVNVKLTQKPTAKAINISAHAPKTVGITKVYPTATTIHLVAHAPKIVGITKIYPTVKAIHLLANTVKTNLTQKPTPATIHISAHAPKTVSITKIYPTPATIQLVAKSVNVKLTQHPAPATINLSAHAPKSVGISKVYPSHSTIHLSVSAPSNRLTQHVSRCVVHLALPPPKLNCVVHATPATMHLLANTAMFVQSKVRPNPCTIHLTVPTSKVITVIVKFHFTVKMESTKSFKIILPDFD